MCVREVLRKQPMAYGRLLFILTQASWSVYTKGGLAGLHQLCVPKLGSSWHSKREIYIPR